MWKERALCSPLPLLFKVTSFLDALSWHQPTGRQQHSKMGGKPHS